jgi:hypothetical protein
VNHGDRANGPKNPARAVAAVSTTDPRGVPITVELCPVVCSFFLADPGATIAVDLVCSLIR